RLHPVWRATGTHGLLADGGVELLRLAGELLLGLSKQAEQFRPGLAGMGADLRGEAERQYRPLSPYAGVGYRVPPWTVALLGAHQTFSRDPLHLLLVRAAHINRLFVQVSGEIETSPRACRAALPRGRKHRQFHQRTVKRDRPIRLLNGVGDRAEADLVPAAALDLYLGEPAQHRLTALVLQCPRQQVRNLAGSDQAGVPACDHIPLVFGRRDHRAAAEPAKDLGDIGTAALSQSLQRPER